MISEYKFIEFIIPLLWIISFIIGLYFVITGCDPAHTNKCTYYDTFHGTIFSIEIIPSNLTNVWIGNILALSDNNICIYTHTNSLSYHDTKNKMNGYKIGQHVDWIKDKTNICYYPNHIAYKWNIGLGYLIVSSIALSIIFLFYCYIWFLRYKTQQLLYEVIKQDEQNNNLFEPLNHNHNQNHIDSGKTFTYVNPMNFTKYKKSKNIHNFNTFNI